MLATSERNSPCSAFDCRSSSLRLTWRKVPAASGVKVTFSPERVTLPISTLTLRCVASSSFPLGPSTKTLPSANFTLTPAGMLTACLPIRDIARLLPNDAEQFPTQLLGPGLPAAHHALARAENADPQTVQHWPDLVRTNVLPQPRPALPLDVAND